MDKKLVNQYAEEFDNFCTAQNKKSTICQEHKALAWRISFIIAKAIWGYDNPTYTNINDVFKELKFPYNENAFKNFIDASYEYNLLDEDEAENTAEGKLQLEFFSYIKEIEKQENINWFKEYCEERHLTCTLKDDIIAELVDEELYLLVKDYGLPKRKEFLLMDEIFKIVTFPKDEETYEKFKTELLQDEIQDALDEL